jgi:hypothetical protein
MSRFEKRLRQLLTDHGYRKADDLLIKRGIRGWTTDRIVGRFPSTFAACEYLIPRLADDEYTRQFRAITG